MLTPTPLLICGQHILTLEPLNGQTTLNKTVDTPDPLQIDVE